MEFQKIIGEIEALKDFEKLQCEKIKSHGLPVIILGAAKMAKLVTDKLNSFDIPVAGYSVTEDYYKPGQSYLGKPVYNYSEVHNRPKDYVFVLGLASIGNPRGGGYSLAENFINDKEIIRYIPPMIENGLEPVTLEYISQNLAAYTQTFNWLEDELSKKSMLAYLKQKTTGDASDTVKIFFNKSFFYNLTAPFLNENCVYFDCGAFDGDTIKNFIDCSNNKYKKIFGVEADSANFEKLKNFVEKNNYSNVELFNCGVWNEKGVLSFNSNNDMSSAVSFDGSGETSIAVDTIDNILNGEPATFIKMDIEGSELNALKGAAQTIKENKPVLAICVYHKSEDLFTIPQFIKNLHEDYKFYMRYHTILGACDLVLYALPR